MRLPVQLARHFREVHFGGNWTDVNLKSALEGLDWQQANAKVHSLNTILALTFHINYYISAVIKVLEGGALEASDKYSMDHPPVSSQQEWDQLLKKVWADAEQFAIQVEQMPETKLWENMADPKYGTWHRNILGIVEHSHYHLGQIVLIKKLLSANKA